MAGPVRRRRQLNEEDEQMSTASRVPETALMGEDELSADEAAATLRRFGRWSLAKHSFTRLRAGDGFTMARALGFQLVLALIPLVIALIGLSSTLRTQKVAAALRATLTSVSPGGSSGDPLQQALQQGEQASRSGGGQLALLLGLLTALVALTSAMAQVERGANRIYGIQKDRPSVHRYLRAALLALVGGVPALAGFLSLVAGGTFVHSLGRAYGWSGGTQQVIYWLHWPAGALLCLITITVIFRWSPRRRQPGPTWLAFGAGLAFVLWMLLSGALAVYIRSSGSFGTVYGPLTGIIALLLWAQLTAVALLFGLAFSAQLEAVHAGDNEPRTADPEVVEGGLADHGRTVILAPRDRPARAARRRH